MTEDEEPNPWAEVVGPCYSTTSLAHTLGCTEAKVTEAGEALRLLALETDDGVALYPAFQLRDS